MNQWLFILPGLATAGAILWWDIASDFRDWRRNKPINHSNQGFKRIMLLLVPTGLLAAPLVYGLPFHSFGQIVYWLLCIGVTFLMICFWYWLFFDGLYSNKRRFNFWHLGSDDPGDGTLDNFLQSLTRAQHIAVKVGGAVVFTVLYILFKS